MKRTRSVMLAAILLLSAMVVFAGTAAAYTDEEFENAPPIDELENETIYPDPPEGETWEDPKWYGQVTNAGTGDPMPGLTVKLYKKAWFFGWYLRFLGSDTTDANGDYSIVNRFVYPEGQYYLRISDGTTTETYPRYLCWNWGQNDYTWAGYPECIWTYQWNQTTDIPEFATIAIPAVALLGLFAFYRRKQKK